MPFQKGQSGNPLGQKTKRQWIKEQERFREAKATWRKLIDIRDGLVLERREIGKDEDGEPITADVVPSVKDYLACCKQIMDRAVGLPSQSVELSGQDGEPLRIFMEVLDNKGNNGSDPELRENGLTVHLGGGNGHEP